MTRKYDARDIISQTMRKKRALCGADHHNHSGQENIIKKAERADVIFFVIMLYVSQCIDRSRVKR